MSRYKPYPAYRDSGVEWIGKIPSHWKLSSVKWEFSARLGKMLQPSAIDAHDVEVPYHKAVSVQWESVADAPPEKMWASESDIEAYALKDGDLLICEGGDVGRAAIFKGETSEPIIFQNSLHRVRPKNKNNPKILLRLLQLVRQSGWFDVLCSKATIVHFTGEKLGSLPFPVAPPEEQLIIDQAIDRETARIDALIEKKTRFIELLREKRQALITHSVTKGLNPNAKMKDSGVEWLGEVPDHWDVGQLRHFARLGSGHTPSREKREYWENCTTPWFTLADVWQIRKSGKKIVSETEEKVSELGLANSAAVRHKAGSVILSRTASVGFSAIMGCDMATSQDFAVWTCGNKLNNHFLYWTLMGMKPDFARIMMGSTHKTIYMPDIEAIRVPVPPEHEQAAIVTKLENQILKSRKLEELSIQSIELLKERRSALITAAVTGQIDLREAS